MMIKYVTKTTKEYTYDKEGRIAKEVITEEYSEHDTNEKESKSPIDSIKKAVGVPYTGGTTISYDTSSPFLSTQTGDVTIKGNLKVEPNVSAKADTSGINHNIVVNLAEKGLSPEEVAKLFKNTIRKHSNF